jgi:hypothetical protein
MDADCPADVADAYRGRAEQLIAILRDVSGQPDATTVANTRHVLDQIVRGTRRGQSRAIALVADDRAEIDSVTSELLQPLAKAVMAGDADALPKLRELAKRRWDELGAHKRVRPDRALLEVHCGVLRFDFDALTGHDSRSTDDLKPLGAFALGMLDASGLPTDQYVDHADRLYDLLLGPDRQKRPR